VYPVLQQQHHVVSSPAVVGNVSSSAKPTGTPEQQARQSAVENWVLRILRAAAGRLGGDTAQYLMAPPIDVTAQRATGAAASPGQRDLLSGKSNSSAQAAGGPRIHPDVDLSFLDNPQALLIRGQFNPEAHAALIPWIKVVRTISQAYQATDQRVRNTLLLQTFEHFKQIHMESRGVNTQQSVLGATPAYYNPQHQQQAPHHRGSGATLAVGRAAYTTTTGGASGGGQAAQSVGWDTAVLVTLVQLIRGEMEKEGAVMDEGAAVDAASDAAVLIDQIAADTAPKDSEKDGGGCDGRMVADAEAAVRSMIEPALRRRKAGTISPEALGEVFRSWRELFLFLLRADEDAANHVARRRGALAVLNGLLQILLYRDNLHQSRALLSQVEQLEAQAQGDPKRGVLGPCGHMVAEVGKLLYFLGRTKLASGLYADAFTSLRRAISLLSPFPVRPKTSTGVVGVRAGGGGAGSGRATPSVIGSSAAAAAAVSAATSSVVSASPVMRNKQRHLFFWMVAALCAGAAPPPALLFEADPVIADILTPIFAATVAGHVGELRRLFTVHGPVLRKRAVWVNLLPLQEVATVSVLRRVHAVIAARAAAGGDQASAYDPSRVPLALFHKVFTLLNPELDPIVMAAAPSPLARRRRARGGDDEAATDAAATSASGAASAQRGGGAKAAKANGKSKNGAGSPQVRPTMDPAAVASPGDIAVADSNDEDVAAEVCARLAPLIQGGWIRGYLSYEHSTLVLAKKDPFLCRLPAAQLCPQ
jgi:hypothetical protein